MILETENAVSTISFAGRFLGRLLGYWINSGGRPQGAEVYVGNRLIGITPLHMEEVAKGKNCIILKKAGYVDLELSVSISGEQETVVIPDLIPTLSAYEKEVRSSLTPYSPQAALLAKQMQLFKIEKTEYWHPITPLGHGELFAIVFEEATKMALEAGTLSDLAQEQREVMGALGLPSLWNVRNLTKNVALVNFIDFKGASVAVFDQGHWWLVRSLERHESFETISYSEVVKNTKDWL